METTGIVFNIAKGSYVDGHGIRTTVFLKGCPLRCLWCCNPEGQKTVPEPKISPTLCTCCGDCYEVCAERAIGFADGKITGVDRNLCTCCGECYHVCYTKAIDTFDTVYTVDEVFEIVNKDKDYYFASGGGLTIGGGEPTLQAAFTGELMKKCHDNGIHVALDTCGYTVSEEGRRLLEEADLLLFDIKGVDPEIHKNNTGVSNKIILANLKHLDEIGKDIIIRLPIIPGYTDQQENIRATVQLLSEMKCITRVDLMEYHQYGVVKYAQLGMDYRLDNSLALRSGLLEEIKEMLEDHGLKVQLGG